MSVCSKFIERIYFNFCGQLLVVKKNKSYPSICNSFISSFLAASVPYTIGVHMDDIEYHKGRDKGDAEGTEQAVAPGTY